MITKLDAAIYETFARMSQPWINNIPEIDWHGANGSVKGGPEPASARYTEARLSKASEDGFFTGIKKNVVKMIPNFSEDDEWPEVLPAIFPRLFVNGSQGIGYTIANSWLPNNLNEFYEKVKEYLDNDGVITYDDIYPDFPSGGIIINKDELKEIYLTGKGKAVLRAKTEIQGSSILITELPYQVYVEPLINSIKDLVNKEEITGIKDIYNKCDKTHLLIEIECDGSPKVILNKLFAMTELQKTYSANQYAMITKVPELLNLKQYIKVYVEHNLSCIVKEKEFDLDKAKERLEIVNGLLKALEDIDNVIKTIKESDSAAVAKKALCTKYKLTENQASAILDMKLAKLAHLEALELQNEQIELNEETLRCITFLSDTDRQQAEFLKRLKEFVEKYGWTRRTQVVQLEEPKEEEKEIIHVEPEQCMVIISKSGYIKRVPLASFRAQKRNGIGVKTQDDITLATIRTNTIDKLLVFSNTGMIYRLLVNEIPVGNNTAKGTSIKALIEMDANETVEAIYSIYRDTEAKFVVFATRNGMIKKTPLTEYVGPKKKNGMAALKLKDDDGVVSVTILKDEDIILASSSGKVIRIKSSDISISSRVSLGVKGITLENDEKIVAMATVRDTKDDLAVFSTKGFGKRIPLKEITTQKRGGKGVYVYKPDSSRGTISALAMLNDEDNILISGTNTSICIPAKTISVLGRTSKGVAVIKDSDIVSVSKV